MVHIGVKFFLKSSDWILIDWFTYDACIDKGDYRPRTK
jgi:hypothetical protein